MILYYALGGGLGHITRAQAVVHTLRQVGKVRLVTSSIAARGVALARQFDRIEAPLELARDLDAHRRWLRPLLRGVRKLYVDCFVGGLVGELCQFEFGSDLELVHVARRLKWRKYAARLQGPPPHYDRCYILEELEEAHARFVEAQAGSLATLALEDYPLPLNESALKILDSGSVFSLLVHSGPSGEIIDLLNFASEVRRAEGDESPLYVVAPVRPDELPDGVHYRDIYPVQSLFASAQLVFSACGFNIMRQMRPHRHKHRFMPFARPLDDQYARARWARQPPLD